MPQSHEKDLGVVLGKLETMQRQLEQILQQQEWLMTRASSNQSKTTLETDTGTSFPDDSFGHISALKCENGRVQTTWSTRPTKSSMSDV
eukprot:CAMPEP_0172817740 /NCGR_PEP_ID=MMETSP1075-20121228/13432_1 /TAXON_ID=2916 /ORGANISM="Ceratium fusus, Strain PA161109" /LENGTH=88 /DNA_ID=CAMNT_0013657999 /DNA_START=99 /DNA_END=361 /DNA_ORIENTATION=-